MLAPGTSRSLTFVLLSPQCRPGSEHLLLTQTLSALSDFFSLCLVSSAAGPSAPSIAISGGQSLAFTAPSSPVHGPPRPAPAPLSASAPQSPCLTSARPQVCVLGRGLLPDAARGTEVVQQRLEETSTSLAAAVKAVERKLTQEDDLDR